MQTMQLRRTFHCKQVRLDVGTGPRDEDSYHVFQADRSAVQVGRKEVEESGTLASHLLKRFGIIKVGRVGVKRL